MGRSAPGIAGKSDAELGRGFSKAALAGQGCAEVAARNTELRGKSDSFGEFLERFLFLAQTLVRYAEIVVGHAIERSKPQRSLKLLEGCFELALLVKQSPQTNMWLKSCWSL